MDLKHLLLLVRRRWLSIVSVLLLAVAISAAFTWSVDPQYESNARIFISIDGSDSTDAYAASLFTQNRVKSYAALATSPKLMQRVAEAEGGSTSAAQLADKLTAVVEEETAIIRITARDDTPRGAQRIANAEAVELTRYLRQLETPAGKARASVKATVVDPGDYNASPVTPRTITNLVIAALLGLLLGIAFAVARELLDNTVASAEAVEETVHAPILGSFRFERDVNAHPLISEGSSHSPRGEAFRMLRTNLQFLDLDSRASSIVITSALPREGKTSTATNLAIVAAQAGHKVLLVDADLRRPMVAARLGLESAVGLTSTLIGKTTIEEGIQRHAQTGVLVMASGPLPPNPSEMLQSSAANALFEKLATTHDLVIIDAPPVLPVADAAILSRAVDGAILVVRHGHTTKEALRAAAERLSTVDARLLGVVMNMISHKGGAEAGYGYTYGYGPVEEKAGQPRRGRLLARLRRA